jgi:hypothetical protein
MNPISTPSPPRKTSSILTQLWTPNTTQRKRASSSLLQLLKPINRPLHRVQNDIISSHKIQIITQLVPFEHIELLCIKARSFS